MCLFYHHPAPPSSPPASPVVDVVFNTSFFHLSFCHKNLPEQQNEAPGWVHLTLSSPSPLQIYAVLDLPQHCCLLFFTKKALAYEHLKLSCIELGHWSSKSELSNLTLQGLWFFPCTFHLRILLFCLLLAGDTKDWMRPSWKKTCALPLSNGPSQRSFSRHFDRHQKWWN